MIAPKVLKHHADLMDRMARTVGVDLEEAVIGGAARFDDIADAVLRCAGCSNPGHCAEWLAEDTPREAPVGYCRNVDFFADVQRKTAS